MSAGHQYVFFGKKLELRFSAHILIILFIFILSYMSSLYILDINLLSEILFAEYFLPFNNLLFSLWCFTLICKSSLLWMGPVYLFLLLLYLPEETDSKNITSIWVKVFCLCFLLGVLWFPVLKVFNPFWVYFCIWCEKIF